jgi:hypothetical protein
MNTKTIFALTILLLKTISLSGQSKKELIEVLNQRIDSLNVEFIKSQNKYKEITFLQESTANRLKNVMVEKETISTQLKHKSTTLDSLIQIRRKESSLLRDSFLILLNRFRTGYAFPFKLKDTIFSEGQNNYKYYIRNGIKYVIVDTASIYLRKFGNVYFHFIAPIKTSEDLSTLFDCPSNFGLIATDNYGGNIVFEDYWNSETGNKDSIRGNIFSGFQTIGPERMSSTVIKMNSSGCGSGGKSLFYKIYSNDGNIGFRFFNETAIGYSDLVLFDDKDYYVILEKINPEEHFGPARYSIEVKRLSDNSTILKNTTKNKYRCLTDSSPKELLQLMNANEYILSGLSD